MLGVLSPLVQGLIGMQTDDDDDDNHEPAHNQSTRNYTAIRNALSLRKALTAAIRFLVQPNSSREPMPHNLITNLRKECSAEFRGNHQCCIADFYTNLFWILGEGLSGMCSNFFVLCCLVTLTWHIHSVPF